MELKWIGAALIIAGGGGVGALMAYQVKKECSALEQLLAALGFMACELEYRLTPLPELCRQVAEKYSGCTAGFFRTLAQELEGQVAPNVTSCVRAALTKCQRMPQEFYNLLKELGSTLGIFDLSGQLSGLEAVQASCRRQLEELEQNRGQRLRSYQTLGLCAGAALAILLL